MGRIKTQLIKRTSVEMMTKYPGYFSDNFEDNKKKMAQVAEVPSKKMRNSIAGYVARLSKQQKNM